MMMMMILNQKNNTAFVNVAAFSLVSGYHNFGVSCCLQLRGRSVAYCCTQHQIREGVILIHTQIPHSSVLNQYC